MSKLYVLPFERQPVSGGVKPSWRGKTAWDVQGLGAVAASFQEEYPGMDNEEAAMQAQQWAILQELQAIRHLLA